MGKCTKYVRRFRKALEYRNLTPPQDLMNMLAKRAESDRQLDQLVTTMCHILEPPYCQKSHCPHHTTYAFCGCSKELVPGKCPLNLDYLKRKKDKEDKFKTEVIDFMVGRGCDSEHAEMYFEAGPSRFGGMDRFRKAFTEEKLKLEKEANNG